MLLALSVRMRVLIAIVAAMVAAAVIFAVTASYALIETVSGWVVPEGGLIRVTARQGGVIQTLNIVEGAMITAGQPLAVLRLSQDSGRGDSGTAIADYLQVELESARAQSDAERERLAAQQQNLHIQRQAMQQELDASRGRVAAVQERLQLLRNNSDRVRIIAERGYASNKSGEDSEMNVLMTEQEMVGVRTSIMALEREIQDMDAQLQALPFQIRAADAQARASRAALERQGTQLAVANTYRATAPLDGRVVAVPVARGQTLDAQAAVAVIQRRRIAPASRTVRAIARRGFYPSGTRGPPDVSGIPLSEIRHRQGRNHQRVPHRSGPDRGLGPRPATVGTRLPRDRRPVVRGGVGLWSGHARATRHVAVGGHRAGPPHAGRMAA